MCTCSSESQSYPRLYQEKCSQQVEGGGSSPQFSSCETSPGVLHPTLGSPVQDLFRQVQRRAMKMVRGLENLCYKKRLRVGIL